MSAPWYLLAVGIVILIVGYILAAINRPPPTYIDPRMSDEQIARNLDKSEGGSWAGLLVLAGYVLVFISVAWRIILFLVAQFSQ